MQGWYPFGDDRNPMGFSEKTIFINNAAHEFTEKDGTIWSTAIAVEPTSDNNLFNA